MYWSEHNPPPTVSCAELLKQELNSKYHYQTRCMKLDDTLKKVLVPGKVIEVCGLPTSGKTEFCLHLSICFQMPDISGESQNVIFINTNRNFASHYLEDIIRNYSFESESVMKNIHYIETDTVVKLEAYLHLLEDYICQNRRTGLIILDSISYLLKQVACTKRAVIGSIIIRKFLSLARRLHLTVVVVNDMTTRLDAGNTFTTSSLGDSFYHCINSRILLSKRTSDSFEINFVKSLVTPTKNATFYIR